MYVLGESTPPLEEPVCPNGPVDDTCMVFLFEFVEAYAKFFKIAVQCGRQWKRVERLQILAG